MVAPRKYPEELREWSIRMTLEARKDLSRGRETAGGSVSGWDHLEGWTPYRLRHGHAPARERDVTDAGGRGGCQTGAFIVSRSTGAL